MVSNLFPLDTLLNELYNKGLLSVRSFNALFNAGLTTISEVVNYIQKGGSLMTLPHLGKKSYEETRGFFEPYLSPLLNVELSTKNALGNAIFQNSQEQEINQYIKRTFAKYYYAALSSDDVKYDTFKRKFSNVQDIWEAILTDSEKLFKPDIASSFFQNFIACITVYRIINGVINDLDKDKIGIPIVYDLCKIRHRFNHNPYLTSVMFALNSLGEIKNMFLSDYFQTKLTQQSVRTQNVITKEIGDFPNMLSFILADMNPINLKSMGKQSAIEFKLFGNDILQKTEEVSRTDTNCIYLLFYKSTFSFIPQNKWATIEYFFKINGHMPMFLVLLNYLLQSNQRNDNILKEYYGIGCSRKTIGEISETYKVSKQTVANIINDTNIPVYFKSHWSYYRFLSEKFLSSKTSNYKDINDSEFLYLNYVSYLGLCCIIKPYRLFEYKEKYYIIDKAIWKNYNFKKTFSYINSLANNIHLEDIRVDFHSLITHLQKDYNRQYYIAIKKTLRTIMEDNYNVDINDSEVIFKANKINKAKEIYKILVDKGTPLSEYEIFDIFKKNILRNLFMKDMH